MKRVIIYFWEDEAMLSLIEVYVYIDHEDHVDEELNRQRMI